MAIGGMAVPLAPGPRGLDLLEKWLAFREEHREKPMEHPEHVRIHDPYR